MDYRELRVKCIKGEAKAIGQFIRQLALTRLTSWRPIGFRLCRDNTNVLHSSDDIIPSMIDLANSLSLMHYVCDRKDNVTIEETYSFTKALTSNDLQGMQVKCITEGEQILTSISSDPITLKVYFRYGYGKYSIAQNLNYLQSTGKYRTDIKAIPSTHSPIESITFNVKELNLDEEELIFKVCANTHQELELMLEVIDIAMGRLEQIKSQIL